VHNQTLAILVGRHPEAWPAMVRARLLPYLRDEAVPGARPSSYWVGYVYGVMNRLGHGVEVVRHIRRHFAPMIPFGGTRENWNSGTHTHAWAAHPIQHLAASLGGVRQTAPGWARIEFAPVTGVSETAFADVLIPTPRGDIRAGWRRAPDGRLDIRLRLPAGVSARCRLPDGVECARTSGTHRWQTGVRSRS